jgi:hypothetical protein
LNLAIQFDQAAEPTTTTRTASLQQSREIDTREFIFLETQEESLPSSWQWKLAHKTCKEL